MSWATEIVYYQLFERKNTAFTTENKTVQQFRFELQAVANAPLGTYETVKVPFEVEYVRSMKTIVTVKSYECRGIEEAVAKAAVDTQGNYNMVTGEYIMTEVSSDRCNAAGGWMVSKTVTQQTITRGRWQLYEEPA